jgi:hypothetical protein
MFVCLYSILNEQECGAWAQRGSFFANLGREIQPWNLIPDFFYAITVRRADSSARCFLAQPQVGAVYAAIADIF